MKYWQYVYPSDGHYNYGVETYSDDDIINEYWDYWKDKMICQELEEEISRENCIDDWVVINWAFEIAEEEYKKTKGI